MFRILSKLYLKFHHISYVFHSEKMQKESKKIHMKCVRKLLTLFAWFIHSYLTYVSIFAHLNTLLSRRVNPKRNNDLKFDTKNLARYSLLNGE